MIRELICIRCPRGCHLKVDEQLNVEGNLCPRGQAYGKQEVSDPRRILTSTCRIDSSKVRVVAVKTASDISKNLIFKAMRIVNQTHVRVPIHIGDVIVKDIAGSGVDLVATENVLE